MARQSFGRRLAIGTAGLGVALSATLAAPTANADDAGLLPRDIGKVDQRTLESFGSFVPAIVGAVSTPTSPGVVNTDLLDTAKTLASANGFPPNLRAIWQTVIDFLKSPKSGGGGPEIPHGPGAPVIQQFLYPTVGNGCIPGGSSVGAALVTAGPQQAPAPGPKKGEAGFVYTSLGTGPALANKRNPLSVSWINIDTGKSGTFTLQPNPKINADKGPGTFTGIAKTGKGRVVATIFGDVTTKTQGKTVSCTIVPTVGLSYI